jgi:hypothetical protein
MSAGPGLLSVWNDIGAEADTVRAVAGKLVRVLGAPRPARLYALLEARTKEPRREL